MNVEDRRWAKVVKTATCWIWTGAVAANGYGSVRGTTAHRWAYIATYGEIPHGLDLDHLCRNKICCNPDHLEPVTRSENLRRGYAARGLRTECRRGHPYTADNTGVNSVSKRRFCRECDRASKRAYKHRLRVEAQALTQSTTQPKKGSRA